LVVNEKRAGLKNLHLVNLLPTAIRPLPFYLHGLRAHRGPYTLRIPKSDTTHVGIGYLLPQALSRRLTDGRLPKGLRVAKLSAADLARIKTHWLRTEMRGETSWEHFLKTFDVKRQFSVDAASKGVELPLDVKKGEREDVMLLVRTGDLKRAPVGPLASLTLLQCTAAGEVLGGSTFVFKRRPMQ
jgi:hypothetical protein